MKTSYNKLVRDRIPEIIRANGEHPVTRVLDQDSYRAALLEKLTEEASEVREASTEQLATELGDVLEVLQAIAEAHRLSWDHVLEIAARKRAKGGAFRDRIFLEYVEGAN